MKNKEKIKLIMLVLILPIFLISIISTYAVTGLLSSEVSYDRSTSKLRSNNVQDAIDELNNKYKNTEDLKCPVGKKCNKLPASITFDANGGTFEGNKETNTVYYYNPEIKISKTSNVDDEGNKTGNMPKASSGITDTVTIEGADSLEVEITYQTYTYESYSWVTVNDGDTSPSTSNYGDSISGKLYGTTKTTKTYKIEGDTVKFFFYNDGSYNNYLGYYAKVKEIVKASGTYKTPTKENYGFRGWNTKEDGSGTTYKTDIDVNNIIDKNSNITLYAIWGDYVCKRATTLHTAKCNNSSNGCNNVEGNGNTITYGSLGTSGVLTSGDAFDCDIYGNGNYTFRFYYVSDYFDTQSKSFNNDVAVLIYYENSSNNYYSYYEDAGEAWHGPQKDSSYSIYSELRSITTWDNISLYKSIRSILNENGGNTISRSGTTKILPKNYNYEDKAARFLTYQELQSACGSTPSIDNCEYLFEKTYYQDTSYYRYGYWLETVRSDYISHAYTTHGAYPVINFETVTNYNNYYARPVIEVLKSAISY